MSKRKDMRAVVIPQSTWEGLQRVAKAEDRSRPAIIRRVLVRLVSEHNAAGGAGWLNHLGRSSCEGSWSTVWI